MKYLDKKETVEKEHSLKGKSTPLCGMHKQWLYMRTTYAFLRNVVLPPVSRYNALGEQICGCNLQYINLDSKHLAHIVCFAELVYGPFGQSNMHHTLNC